MDNNNNNTKGITQKYENFVIQNADQINNLESAIRSMTYILPGKYKNTEFISEAVYGVLNMVSLYHDSILASKIKSNRAIPFNRYSRYMLNSSKYYKRIAYFLTIIQSIEGLIEIGVQKRYGEKLKYKIVTQIEVIKACCRMILVYLSSNRMLLSSPLPETNINPNTVSMVISEENKNTWVGPRTGKKIKNINTLKAIRNPQNITDYVMTQALNPDTACDANYLVKPLSKLRTLGELIYILRPVVYIILLRKYGKQSWKPWLVSLMLESFSYTLSTDIVFNTQLTKLEQKEYKRRLYLLKYYLIRKPLFDDITKPYINSLVNTVKKIPIISLVSGILEYNLHNWDNNYFATSSF